MTRSLVFVGLPAVMSAAALIAPAAAASDYYDRDIQTTVISVADLDLSTGWGMDRLIKRLRGRIDDMCGWDEDCRDEAWLSADWQVARAIILKALDVLQRSSKAHLLVVERDARTD